MPDGYFIRARGKITGPFDVPGLQKLVRRGLLSRVHEISSDRLNWSMAGEFEELFPARAAAAAQAAHGSPPFVEQASTSEFGSHADPEQSARPQAVLKFYYAQAGKTIGPVPLGVLEALADNGTLRATDPVWQENAQVAAPACQVPHLASRFSAAVPRIQF